MERFSVAIKAQAGNLVGLSYYPWVSKILISSTAEDDLQQTKFINYKDNHETGPHIAAP